MAGKHGVCCGRSVIRARSRKLLGYKLEITAQMVCLLPPVSQVVLPAFARQSLAGRDTGRLTPLDPLGGDKTQILGFPNTCNT